MKTLNVLDARSLIRLGIRARDAEVQLILFTASGRNESTFQQRH